MFEFNFDKRLISGHSASLLNDGDSFYPRLFDCIQEAKSEILIETFILEEDDIGLAFKDHLVSALDRGVKVIMTIDSWGSHYLATRYIESLVEAGAEVLIFDPQPYWLKGRPKVVNRLHRKLAVFDQKLAFLGGINICDEHITAGNPGGKRDYMVEVEGPVVQEIRQLCLSTAGITKDLNENRKDDSPAEKGEIDVALVTRDNWRHRTDIEKAYIERIRAAKKRVLIANAYIFPSYRMLRALTDAAKRGVDVKVVTQGKPDLPFFLTVTHSIYRKLVLDGVDLYEYMERPFHGKIAVFDDDWCTVGSSNLDPWSLGSNLEANVFFCDERLSHEVFQNISYLIEHSKRIDTEWVTKRSIFAVIRDTLFFHFVRWWPKLTRTLPNERPKVRNVKRSYLGDEKENDWRVV